jgi:ubiquinone/menaquinone biosynthesis C-methylase UbiE
MEKRDWENTYSTSGVVQDGVLPTVREAVQIMKERRCKKVLDLCCGTGRHTLFLAKNGFDVSGVDSSKSGIAITGSRAKEIGVDVTLKIADMTCTDFLDNTFDAVICVWSTGHGKKSEYFSRTIREMFHSSSPRGCYVRYAKR